MNEEKNSLCVANVALAVFLAKKKNCRCPADYADLVSEAYLALVQASRHWRSDGRRRSALMRMCPLAGVF